jgi:type I restriction enzyme S subunit
MWDKVKLGEVLEQYRNTVIVQPDITYKQLSISKKDGVHSRGYKIGHQIGRKRQFQIDLKKHPNTIIFTRQTLQPDKAIGLVPNEADEAIVTENMPMFSVNRKKAEPKFIEYYLFTAQFYEQLDSTTALGTAQKTVHERDFILYEIPLPPLSEQKRIVEKLDAIKSRIDEAKNIQMKQLKELKNILFSKFHDSIKNSKLKKMRTIAPIIRRPVKVSLEEKYPELGIRSFGKGTFHKPAINGINVGTKKIFQIHKNDLLFSNVFSWEGAIAVVKNEDHKRVGSHRFISCVCDETQVFPEFVCFYLLSPEGIEKIRLASPGGAGRNKTLGLKKLEEIEVPVPSLFEQMKFIQLKEKINRLLNTIEKKHDELDTLFPNVLEKAFRGEM